MSKSVFAVGLVVLFPIFVFTVQLNQEQADVWDVIQQAVGLEIVWLGLAYLGWLGTRWNRGHWNANALSSSSKQRRFLLVGTMVGALFSLWGRYLGIADRVLW